MPKNNQKPNSSFLAANPSTRSYVLILQIIGLAAAYFVTGKLGTYLAIPPGYATAIWPPSGIALASVLIYGYRVWPGILLGSFLVNISTALVGSSFSEILTSVIITLSIGGGASLQAVVGGYLVRRFAGFPNLLCGEKEVFLFFLFGGLLSTWISSTIAVSVLASSARIPATNFLTNWGTWWMGDTLGIFIFTPLVLVWTQKPSESWHSRRIIITLPIVLMFVLTTAAVFYESQNESKRIKFEFDQHATALNAGLKSSILTHLNVLRSVGNLYIASKTVEREEFRSFVAQPLNELHGIQALEWVPLILSPERESFESSLRSEGYRNFQITEQNPDKQLARAGNRPEYVAVSFIEPYQGNEIALGYDLYSDELRHEAIDKARDSGEITTTARITLVQENDSQYGALAFLPVYRNGIPHQTLEQRRNNILGYVVGVFRDGDIVTSALKELDRKGLSYQLIDESASAAEQLIFSSDGKQLNSSVQQKHGLFARNIAPISNFVIPVGGRSWRFEVVPTQEFFALHRSNTTWLILFSGLILTSIMGVFSLVSFGSRKPAPATGG